MCTYTGVTLVRTDALQSRDHNAVLCTFITIDTDCELYHASKVSSSSFVQIALWVYRTGADHSVTFINGFIGAQACAQIFMTRGDDGHEHHVELPATHINSVISGTDFIFARSTDYCIDARSLFSGLFTFSSSFDWLILLYHQQKIRLAFQPSLLQICYFLTVVMSSLAQLPKE